MGPAQRQPATDHPQQPALTPPSAQFNRTLRSITYGSLAWAPIAYKWNKLLSGITYPSSTLKTVLCRVAIDMALFTSFATCYFFTCMGLLEGRTWKEIQARIDRNYSTVVWTNISIFGPAQIINMSLVPVYGRPPFLNLVSLGYNCFLATLNNNTPALAAGAAEN